MAKPKQRSAAQQREQVRQQRDQRLNAAQNIQNRQHNVRKRPAKNNPWPLIGILVAIVAIVIGAFFFIQNQQTTQNKQGQDNAVKTITSLDPKLLAAVGPGTAKPTLKPVSGAPILKGPTGKPEFFYVGGEYCPYCAAQRWSVITALSRFGTFGPLQTIQASEGNIPTFTFHNVTYTSQYIDFVALETADNNNQPLDTLNPEQQAIFKTYDSAPYTDSPGSIPFISIANQQVSSGSYYDPQLLANHSYADIVNQIKDTNSDISRGMLGSANYLTAAICSVTNNQPANVCTADPIPQMQKGAFGAGNTQLAAIPGLDSIDVRRQD